MIDEVQIAVNAGYASGVEIGDVLDVLRETNIPDPDAPNESLGTAFVRKGSMRIESVEEKFAIARVLQQSKGLLAPAEPMFTIVSSESAEGRGRVFIEAGDPVDIQIDS
ncbi:FlgT C-terminal domain-containing protein [Arthrobacter koreensis]|uniref:FlgT C-terminal domain-containing protein n=1 Tax=Arthrobacter koreensis TaxID=199136 RepID=UPI002DC02557|nr:FlgT C-terminal domain-containing protein [Arthrobacter koreensis]MEB7447277.1 hypothetical protein [Arthrobacter koreensis]